MANAARLTCSSLRAERSGLISISCTVCASRWRRSATNSCSTIRCSRSMSFIAWLRSAGEGVLFDAAMLGRSLRGGGDSPSRRRRLPCHNNVPTNKMPTVAMTRFRRLRRRYNARALLANSNGLVHRRGRGDIGRFEQCFERIVSHGWHSLHQIGQKCFELPASTMKSHFHCVSTDPNDLGNLLDTHLFVVVQDGDLAIGKPERTNGLAYSARLFASG